MKKNTSLVKLLPLIFVSLFLFVWELAVVFLGIEKWILPSPTGIFFSLINSFSLVSYHTVWTLFEALVGLIIGGILGVAIAVLMDASKVFKKVINPFLLFTQTVPFIVIAPLLVVWFGFGITAKIIIIALVCLFPIALNVEQGFTSSEKHYLKLVKSMGASNFQIFNKVKLPSCLPYFFSGLKIAASYSVLTAVVSEWIGSERGLGILLIRSSKSYLTERVFAVVVIISLLSFILVKIVDFISVKASPWHYKS